MRDRIIVKETDSLSLAQFEVSLPLDNSPHGARTPLMDENLIREEIAKLREELPHGAETILYYMREGGLTITEAKEVWVKYINNLCGGLF